jgi:hypothetical protein
LSAADIAAFDFGRVERRQQTGGEGAIGPRERIQHRRPHRRRGHDVRLAAHAVADHVSRVMQLLPVWAATLPRASTIPT